MLTLEVVTDMSEFINFPFLIYRNNPYWVPPLISEEKKSMNAKINPFIKNSEIIFFVAKRNREIVGRISLGVGNFYGIEGKVAFFGHFEVVDDFEIFKYVFTRISSIIKERNIPTLIGPINFSTNYSCGLLVDNFDKQPAILMPYNMEYYPRFFERVGLTKFVDLYSFEIEDDFSIPQNFIKFRDALLDKFTVKNIGYEYLCLNADQITDLFNKTWAQNLLFQKLAREEILFLIDSFKHILNPAISFGVEYNNELIGFSISLPDYSYILKYLNGKFNIFKLIGVMDKVKKIDRLRTAILGVSPSFRRKGIDVLMIMKTIEEGRKNKFKKAEVSWILETNKLLLNTIAKLQPKHRKVYRIYSLKS